MNPDALIHTFEELYRLQKLGCAVTWSDVPLLLSRDRQVAEYYPGLLKASAVAERLANRLSARNPIYWNLAAITIREFRNAFRTIAALEHIGASVNELRGQGKKIPARTTEDIIPYLNYTIQQHRGSPYSIPPSQSSRADEYCRRGILMAASIVEHGLSGFHCDAAWQVTTEKSRRNARFAMERLAETLRDLGGA